MKKSKWPPGVLLPSLFWLVMWMAIPLGLVASYSFATKGTYGGIFWELNFQNYVRAMDWIYLKIVWNSIKLATLTTLLCLILGFPLAWVLATSSPRRRALGMVAVVIPFWTNFVVRVYSIKMVLSEVGPINQLGLTLGLWSEPLAFSGNTYSVLLGMVINYLPFMVLPLFVALDQFDFTLLEAAQDLGASSQQTWFKVLIPATRAGWVTGALFVFTPALGEFVIPDLLGGAKTMLVGNLITEQFLKARDWPFGSAISLLLMLGVGASLVIYLRWVWSATEGRESRLLAGQAQPERV